MAPHAAFAEPFLLLAMSLATIFTGVLSNIQLTSYNRANSKLSLEFSGPSTIQYTLMARISTGNVVCGGYCGSFPTCIGFSFRESSPDTIICKLASNASQVNQVTTQGTLYWKKPVGMCLTVCDRALSLSSQLSAGLVRQFSVDVVHYYTVNRTILENLLQISENEVQLNLYLRTELVKNGCTYCEKYLYRDMDFHRLTCEVV
jgi:hypothetical protein